MIVIHPERYNRKPFHIKNGNQNTILINKNGMSWSEWSRKYLTHESSDELIMHLMEIKNNNLINLIHFNNAITIRGMYLCKFTYNSQTRELFYAINKSARINNPIDTIIYEIIIGRTKNDC